MKKDISSVLIAGVVFASLSTNLEARVDPTIDMSTIPINNSFCSGYTTFEEARLAAKAFAQKSKMYNFTEFEVNYTPTLNTKFEGFGLIPSFYGYFYHNLPQIGIGITSNGRVYRLELQDSNNLDLESTEIHRDEFCEMFESKN